MAERQRILSIDGGGIRGIIPATVLAAIEERTGKRIAELFDLIAGTSTGGILALGLTVADGGPVPKWSAAALRELYFERGRDIFRAPLIRVLSSGFGLIDERYPSEGIEDVLREYFGEARLAQALAPVLVTAYEIELRQPFFFRSERARAEPERYDYPAWQAARATSAAPTYFEAARVPAPEDPNDAYALIDGGVFANNPSMCALVDAIRGSGQEPGDLLMVSLGTGELTRRIPFAEARDFGLAEWARPLLNVVMDGVSDATDFQCRQILGERHFRFQTPLETGMDDLDDVSQTNMEALAERAKRLVADRSADLDRVCAELTG
jgi:patatin-like phospholipase/acyl hydrolase